MMVNKWDKEAAVVDVTIPRQSIIRKKEDEKLKKFKGLKEGLERLWE